MNYILLFIIIILLLLVVNFKEPFTPELDKTVWYGYDIRDDDFFKNVKTFENDVNEYGIEKCLKTCDGGCVEYGVSGVAYCFPNERMYKKN